MAALDGSDLDGPADPDERAESQQEPVELARRGVRAWVRAVGRRTGSGLRTATPYGVLAFLAASAVAPVAGAGLGLSGEFAAALNQVGGMGSNYLADLLAGTAARARGDHPSTEQWRDAVAADLLPRLESTDENGRLLREEVAAVLRAVDAVGVALAESADGDLRSQEEITLAFGALGSEVGELRWILVDVSRSLAALQQRLAEHGSERREQMSMIRQALVMIAQLRRDLRNQETAEPESTDPDPTEPDVVSPYPGLASFQPAEADWFFGRAAMVSLLLGRLAEQTVGAAPLAVVGISGAGKSSLLRAGLLPAVAAGGLGDDAGSWPWLLMTPGSEPLAELIRRTAAHLDTDPEAELAVVRRDPQRFGELAARAGGTGRLLIVIDQFEELFTQCADPAERTAFALAVSAAAPAIVVFAVRADFYPQCTQLAPLARALADQVVLGPMSADELRSVVLGPAGRAGLSVEPGLVEVLLTDLGARPGVPYEPGALPLLSHALRATWSRREGRRLTVAGYRRTGGIRNALAETAERIYLQVEPDGRQALRTALLSLVAIADDRVPVRRRGIRSAIDPAALGRLVEARLVTAHEDTVEISHEALLTGWPRLSGWLDEASEEILLRQHLAEAAREWAVAEDPGALYRGVRLDRATQWAAGRDDLLDRERRFLAAGVAATEDARLARARTTRRLRRLAAGLAVALLAAVAGGLVAVDQRDNARDRQQQALSGQSAAESLVAGESDPLTAMDRAVTSWMTSPTVEARGALLSAQMLNHIGRLGAGPDGQSVSLNDDGSLVAVGHVDGMVRVWDTATLTRSGADLPAITQPDTSAGYVAFSPDGRFLASGGAQVNRLCIWDMPSGKLLHVLPAVGAMVWRPDSSAVLAARTDAGGDVPIGAWDPVTGRRVASIPSGGEFASSLAISDDGRYLATGTYAGGGEVRRVTDGVPVASIPGAWDVVFDADGVLISSDRQNGRLRRWQVPSGRELRSLTSENAERQASRLAVTPERTLLSTSIVGDSVELWNIAGDVSHAGLPGFVGLPLDIAVSPNGRVLAVTGREGATTIWRRSANWLLQSSVVTDVAFDPAGRQLTSTSPDGNIRIWDVAGRSIVETIPSETRPVEVTYAPDGTLAVAHIDGTIRVRDPAGRIRAAPRLEAGLMVYNIEFSPDGSLLAVVTGPVDSDTEHHRLILLDVATLRQRAAVDIGQVTASTRPVFSPSGDRIVVATWGARQDGTRIVGQSLLRSWRTDGLAPLAGVEEAQTVSDIAAAPDGSWFATVGDRNRVELRDPNTLKVVRTFAPHTSAITRVAVSPDQRLLATVTKLDPVVRLWDPTTGEPVARLSGHRYPPTTLDFDPGSGILATGSQDTQLLLWQLKTDAVLKELCHTLRVTNQSEARPSAKDCPAP